MFSKQNHKGYIPHFKFSCVNSGSDVLAKLTRFRVKVSFDLRVLILHEVKQRRDNMLERELLIRLMIPYGRMLRDARSGS